MKGVLHALGATSPVAVMEVEAFALEDECPDAILFGALVFEKAGAMRHLSYSAD